MKTDRIYYEDCYLSSFDARIVDRDADTCLIYLDRTAFYPSSGGVQFARVNGGKLPQPAPRTLETGVIGLDGRANRLIVVSYCLWVAVAAWQAIKASGRKS